ncbi:MAG: response regulator transcription factor [Bacteroidota bacterium]
MQTICLVEDELSISEMVKMNLELEGFDVKCYADGEVAIKNISNIIEADLVILDVMLPKVSGLDICDAIRLKSNVPILFLSSKGTTSDKIAGLKKGANDYLAKPFELEELLLRVFSLLQRTANTEQKELAIGNRTVDFDTFEVKSSDGDSILVLSKREIDLLKLFNARPGKVISRDEILDLIWGKESYPTSRTIDNYILSFRKIFELDAKNPRYFHSIRSVGYKFNKE